MSIAPGAPPKSSYRAWGWIAQGCCGVLLVLIAVIGWALEPFIMPWRYLSTVERTSQPLIEAIDKYKADHGWPPDNEQKLIPEYLESLPGTGYRGCENFVYGCWRRPDDTHLWRVMVYCDPLVSSHPPTLEFDSDSRVWSYRGGSW